MNAGIGGERTRGDHREVADQLYAFYATGRDLRRLVAIVGEASLSESDRRFLVFADRFESEFVSQGERRSVEETLDAGWALFEPFTDDELKRISPSTIETHRHGTDRT